MWGAFSKLKKLHHSFPPPSPHAPPAISAIPGTPHISDRMSTVRGRACWQPPSIAQRSGSPACLHACGYQHTFAMQHSQAVLQQAAKGTLALVLRTNLCFHLKEVETLISTHGIFCRLQCLYLGRTRNQLVLIKYWEPLIHFNCWRFFLWQMQNICFYEPSFSTDPLREPQVCQTVFQSAATLCSALVYWSVVFGNLLLYTVHKWFVLGTRVPLYHFWIL